MPGAAQHPQLLRPLHAALDAEADDPRGPGGTPGLRCQSCVQRELRGKTTYTQPAAFVTILLLFVAVSSFGGDHAPPMSPAAPPPPSPAGFRRGENCVRGPSQCAGGNRSWDLQDDDGGPCIDARDSPTYLAAYDRAMTFAEEFYAYHKWKRLDFAQIRTAGRAAAATADETGDPYYMQLAVAQLVAQFPDGHVQREALSEDDEFEDCGPAAEEIAARLRFDHIGGGFGLTVAQLDSGKVIVSGVVPGSAAAEKGLKAGDTVTEIDGVSALAAVTNQGAEGWMWMGDIANAATNEHRLSEQFRSIGRAPVGNARSFATTADGFDRSLTLDAYDDEYLTWNISAPLRLWFPPPPAPPGEDAEAVFHHQMLSDGVTGYIGIGEEEIEDMEEQMATALTALRAAGATGLAMDMRGNDGGDDEQVLDILKFFVPLDRPPRVYERASYSNRVLSEAKSGKLKHLMNGTDPEVFGIVDTPEGGAYGILHSSPIDPDDDIWKVPGFAGPWLDPVVCMINRYCDSSCEGIARGFAQLSPGRARVTGFEGTLGSFGMDGGTIVLPGDTTFAVPYGRSLDALGTIQIDSDWTGKGGILPNARLARSGSNMIRFVSARLTSALSGAGGGISGRFNEHDDVELDWALEQLELLKVSQSSACLSQCEQIDDWDLDDDGPCLDARDSVSMLVAYERAGTFLEKYYAYSDWKRLDWGAVRAAGADSAALADSTGDVYYMQLAVAQLVAAIPDGHVQREYITEDCGTAALHTAKRLRADHVGGGYGLTIAQLHTGEVIVTSVIAGSVVATAGIRPGEIVEEIDGVSALEAVRAQGAAGWLWVAQCCSNPATAENRLSEQLRSIVRAPVGTSRGWKIGGRPTAIDTTAYSDDLLTWNLTAPSSPFFDRWSGIDAPDGSVHVHHRMLSSTVGYIGIGEEDVDEMGLEMATALAALTAQGAEAMVVDLRGNDGGDDVQGPEIVRFFVPEGTLPRYYEQVSYSNRLLSVAEDGRLRRYMNGTRLSDYAVVPLSAYEDIRGGGSNDTAMFIEPVDVAHYSKAVPGFTGPFTGPVCAMINRYCDSTCEGVARGFAQLSPKRAAVAGFEGTLGSFGMSGATVVMPGDFTLQLPFGRSLDAAGKIQIDADVSGEGGVLPTARLVSNSSNLIEFVRQRIDGNEHDIELSWAVSVLARLSNNNN